MRKRLPCEHEDLSLTPGKHTKELLGMVAWACHPTNQEGEMRREGYLRPADQPAYQISGKSERPLHRHDCVYTHNTVKKKGGGRRGTHEKHGSGGTSGKEQLCCVVGHTHLHGAEARG